MVLSMTRWSGKVAVVTGASAGIGEAIVEQLVEHGVIVAGLARRQEKVEELAKKLSGKKGKLHALKCDISKEEDIVAAFKWIKANLGPVHILVNNAGVLKNADLKDVDTALWRHVFETNVLGLCICTREALTSMSENKTSGHIIHINSIAGHKIPDYPGFNVYPASKFAVRALAETLRVELKRTHPDIKVTNVSPGLVRTEIIGLAGMGDELFDKFQALEPEDVADAVVCALSTPERTHIHEITVSPRENAA